MKKTLKYIAVCFALFFTFILSTACGGSSLAGIALSCPTLKSLGKNYYAAAVDQGFKVDVKTAPENFDWTDKLIWQSDNTNVAEVDNTGYVNPKSTGRANISARYKDNENINASIQIRVYMNEPDEFSFTLDCYEVKYGDDFQVDVRGDYDDVVFEFSGTLEDGTDYPTEMKNVQPQEAGQYIVTTTHGDYTADARIIISKREIEIPVENYKRVFGSETITTMDGTIINVQACLTCTLLGSIIDRKNPFYAVCSQNRKNLVGSGYPHTCNPRSRGAHTRHIIEDFCHFRDKLYHNFALNGIGRHLCCDILFGLRCHCDIIGA